MCMPSPPEPKKVVATPPAETPQPLASPYGDSMAQNLSQLRVKPGSDLKVKPGTSLNIPTAKAQPVAPSGLSV